MELFLISILVSDYDEAIDYYCGVFGFALIEDTPREGGKRWVVVSPSGAAMSGAQILLAKASTQPQRDIVGAQHGGRVGFFLHTDEFDRTFEAFKAKGVRFCEKPRAEAYGKVVVFKDIYGNKWDLIERG